ncbi:MAG TPA: YciI family protein [Egicoccus sp.]|nr:YciI family protein [Egicoccus sp.]HSK21843.1 YciI family protein [Egicoccus sp.]
MHYLVLLHDDGRGPAWEPGTPEWDAEMEKYVAFERAAGEAVCGGEALQEPSSGAVVRPGGDTLLVTEGPFAEGAEVVGGYYVLAGDDLDQVLALAAQIPVAAYGTLEVRPLIEWSPSRAAPSGATRWLALLHGAPTEADRPGTPQWDAALADHARFGAEHDAHLLGGAALHPPETATTLRVRDGRMLLTDGPFAEGAEVVGGYYEFWADGRDAAVAIAGQIPVGDGAVELRPIAPLDA